jgi:hypothetical protein
MMESELAKWFATLGVGGTLAGVMFMFYRKDVRQFTALWEKQTEVLMTVVKENTVAFTATLEVMKSLHRRLDDLDGLPHKQRNDRQ